MSAFLCNVTQQLVNEFITLRYVLRETTPDTAAAVGYLYFIFLLTKNRVTNDCFHFYRSILPAFTFTIHLAYIIMVL